MCKMTRQHFQFIADAMQRLPHDAELDRYDMRDSETLAMLKEQHEAQAMLTLRLNALMTNMTVCPLTLVHCNSLLGRD